MSTGPVIAGIALPEIATPVCGLARNDIFDSALHGSQPLPFRAGHSRVEESSGLAMAQQISRLTFVPPR